MRHFVDILTLLTVWLGAGDGRSLQLMLNPDDDGNASVVTTPLPSAVGSNLTSEEIGLVDQIRVIRITVVAVFVFMIALVVMFSIWNNHVSHVEEELLLLNRRSRRSSSVTRSNEALVVKS